MKFQIQISVHNYNKDSNIIYSDITLDEIQKYTELIKIINNNSKTTWNWWMRLPMIWNGEICGPDLYNIKFYFDASFAVTNFRSLEQLAKIGVSSVYIADDLCYNLKKVRIACDKYGLELRWILNTIPSFSLNKTTDVRAPIMLPECINELNKYVDVFEFIENKSWVKIDTLYKIWFIKKEWRENLRFIYPELDIDIWNQSMVPNFNIYKMNCGYKCGYGSVCKKCNQFKEIADDLHEKHIEYVLSKEKEGI